MVDYAILAKAMDTISAAARRYKRMHRLARLLLWAAILSPLVVHSYLETISTMQTGTNPSTSLVPGVHVVPCNRLFTGKTVFVVGVLVLPKQCYRVNSTTYLAGDYTTLLVVVGNGSSVVAIVLPVNTTIQNTTVTRTVYILPFNTTQANYTSLAETIKSLGIARLVCKTYRPGDTWGPLSIPLLLYNQTCRN